MTLQIREGGFYKTRDGQKFGPLLPEAFTPGHFACRQSAFQYQADGASCSGNPDVDLIEEWSEPAPQEAGPVRTEMVTRMVIVPGAYGLFTIHDGPNVPFVKLTGNDFINLSPDPDRIEQIEVAAAMFASLAKALRSSQP